MNTNNKIVFKRLCLLLIGFIFSSSIKSQDTVGVFDKVDGYVSSLGSLDTLNMGTIAKLVTQKFSDKKEKARAIFVWISNNISHETKANKATDPKNNTSDAVLKNRRAGSTGYATLFQDMCSMANIRCLTADGFFKRTTENINEKDAEINHSWAVVQLGQSPEEWYYVDVACGSGSLDKKGTAFIKSFEDAYFFADKTIFNYQHYPDNTNWQLGKGPRNKKDFYAFPVIKNGAYQLNINDFAPGNGLIQVKAGKAVSFTVSAAGPIARIALLIEENKKKQIKIINNPTITVGKIKFEHIFENEGSYDITILINDKEVLQYLAEIQ